MSTKPIIPLIKSAPAVATKMDQLFLQQEYGGYKAPEMSVPPTPGLATPMPFTDFNALNQNRVDPSAFRTNNTRGNTLNDLISNASKPTGNQGGGAAFLESQYEGMGRFDSFIPERDNEDANAQQQEWYGKMVNGVTKGLALTGTTFLQTTLGTLNGLALWRNTGKFSSFYDNDFNRALDEFNVWLDREAMPTYETQEFRNAKWYSPDYLFTGNFLWEGIVKNLGFAAGAALSGGAIGTAMKGLSSASRLTAIGKANRAITAAEEAIALGESPTGWAASLAGMTKDAGGLANILDKGYRATVAGLATTGEAGIEAYHNLNEFRNLAIEEYTEKNGYAPYGKDLEKINEAAENIGNASFKMNMGLLSITNYIQFPTILGKNFKADKAIRNEMAPKIKPIEIVDGKAVVKAPSKLQRVGKAISNPYIFSYTEALEEQGQFVISTLSDDFYNKKYRGEDTGNDFKDAINSLQTSLAEAFSDEGMKNFLIGGLSGAIMLGPGRVKRNISQAAATGDAIKKFNETSISGFIKDTQDSVSRGMTLEEEYLAAIDENNMLAANEAEQDYALNYLMPRIKYNRHDLVLSDIQDMENLALTDEGFQQLKDEGKIKENDTKEQFLQRLNSLKQTSIAVAKSYQDIGLKYKSVVDSEGNRIYPDEVVDKMVYLAAKTRYYNEQINDLKLELSAVPVTLEAILTGDQKDLEEAQLAILNIPEINDDQAEDMIEKLNRLAVTEQYRKKSLQEYAEIKSNPEKFYPKTLKDEESEEGFTPDKPSEEGKVLIKTKNFPEGRIYTKGKVYTLGNVYDTDAKGNKVFRFPTLTFIGENEDGSIKIKDNKGVIRDVEKSVFEDYNLGSEEAINKSPDARFYKRNANKVVFWNRGKKKGGVINGRIKWDNKNDNLEFIYKEGGKVRTKIINIDSFEPKSPRFNKGVFYFGKELTKEDRADMKDSRESGRTAEKIKARQEQRTEILTDLYVEVSEKHEKTEKLIEKKKKDILAIKDKLSDLKDQISTRGDDIDRRGKGIKFRKATNEMMAHSLKLSRMIRDLQNEIEVLEEQNSNTLETQAYIEDLIDSLDTLPDNTKDFMNELKFEQMLLEEAAVQTTKQIIAIKDLLKSAKRALVDVLKTIKSLINNFNTKYPNVPQLSGELFNEFLDNNQGSEWINNVKELFAYRNAREALESLQDELVYIEDNATISISEKRVEKLEEHLDIMTQDLKEIESQSKSMQTVIDKFQEIYDTHMTEKALKEAMMLNEQLHKEIFDTLDDGIASKNGYDGYEADAKKSAIDVASSTSVSTDFKEEHVLRANRFAFRFQNFSNKNKIKALVVTNKTDKLILPGLVDFVKQDAENNNRKMDTDKAIFAVFVETTKDGNFLVDENGNRLSEEQMKDPVKHAIFQPFPLENLEARYDGNTDTMFREEVSKEQRENIKEQYKAWRDGILKEDSLRKPAAMSPSFGQPIYEKKWVEKNGEQVEENDMQAKNSVFEAGFIEKKDLKRKQTLQVAVTDGSVSNNGVIYKKVKGRTFLNILEGLVPMRANKFNKKKATTIYKVLHKLSKDLANEQKISSENKDLFKWLRTVVMWGKPKEKLDKDGNVVSTKKPGHSSIWFDYVYNPETNKREPKLFVSQLGFAVNFTPSSLNDNKEAIINGIQQLHHNVKSSFVNEENYKSSYTEIVDVNEDGSLQKKVWDNYQTYLLSDDNRSGGDIPLTTPYKALVEDYDVNRAGIYFTFDNKEEMFDLDTTPTQETEDTPPTEPDTALTTTVPVFNGMTDNRYVLSNGKSYVIYRVNSKGEIINFDLFNADDIKSAIMKREAAAQKEGGAPVNVAQQLQAVETFKNDLKNKILSEVVIPAYEDKITPASDQMMFDEVDNSPLAEDPDTTAIDLEDEELYRLKVENDPYESTENWNKVEKYMKKNFPNIPFYRVKNLIRATKGRKALGMFHKGAMYVYENAEEGTAYHEVFEGVWKMFTSIEERKEIIDEFKARKGSFEDRVSRRQIKYSEASSMEIKEQLAEEFRQFRLKKEAKAKKGVIGKFFQDLKDWVSKIIDWFTNDPSKIEDLYNAMDNGYYASYTPYVENIVDLIDNPSIDRNGIIDIENMSGDETSEFALVPRISVPTRELNDIMQHITYETIKNIFKEDGSLMDNNNYNKAELYYNLNKNLLNKFKESYRIANEQLQKYARLKNFNKVEQYKQEKSKLNRLWEQIEESWEAIVERHVENLQTYNIIFDENDYVLLNDENNSGREDYLDSRKIDPLKKSSAAVKLMLATIPIVEDVRVTDSKTGRSKMVVKAKKSSINGILTMDIGKTFIELMEELSTSKGMDDMMIRLNKLASVNPNYRLLYKRLTGEKFTYVDSSEDTVSPPNYENLSRNQFELISSFWRTFKKQKPDIITVFVLKNGETVVTDTSLTSAAKTAQYKLRNSIVNSIKSNETDGLFAVNRGKFTAVNREGAGFSKVNLDRSDVKTYSDFLQRFGIDFNPGVIKSFNNSQQKQFFRRVEGIRNVLSDIKDASSLAKEVLNIEQDLFQLGILKAVTENQEFQSTYFNVNGEMAQTFIGPNAVSNLHHALANVSNISELEGTEYDYLIPGKDNFSTNSHIMKLLFDENGDRIPGTSEVLKAVFIDGTINERDNVKKDSSRLNYIQRVTQEINSNLKGIYLNLVPGDASIEWAVKLHEENDPFVTADTIDTKDYLSIFKNYLIDEINLVREKRTVPKRKDANGKLVDVSEKLRFFSAILPENLQTKILKYKSPASEIVYSKNTGKFAGIEKEIDTAIEEYVKNKALETRSILESFRLIAKDTDGNLNIRNINLPENMSEKDFMRNMQALSANYMIANIELHKVVYSDPYQYKDELKRIKSFSSPRQVLIHNSNTLNTFLDREYNDEYREPYIDPEDGRRKLIDAGWSDMQSPNLRAVTLADVESRNRYLASLSEELKEYDVPSEEGDGGGLVTIKGKRKIMLRAGMWNEKLESQYRYDIAYEDFYEGRELTVQQLNYFDPQNPLRLNPGVQELYTPLKPIVSGRKGNERNYNDILLDKFALLPISYRLMHQMSEDSNMLALYKKMQNEFIDYAVFRSGRKVGAEKVFQPYKDGKINTDLFETDEQINNRDLPQTVINVPYSIIAIQTEVPTKESGGTTQGSQVTKLATLDMMEAGVPLDYVINDKDGNEIKDITERFESWNSLTADMVMKSDETAEEFFERIEDVRAEQSELYSEIVNNRRLLNSKTKIGYKRLIGSLGITKDQEGNLRITKRDRMSSTLRDEIFSRSVNDNVSESFKGFLNGDVVLEGTPLFQQIRNVLMSIARKNVIRPKINGGFKVQMFNTFFEDNRVEESTDSKGNPIYSSGDLNFYVDEDGKRVCEVMVARWFNSPLSNEEILNSWYVVKDGVRTDELTEQGKKVVEGIGYRIPTQKQNSIDAFRIKKLLPKEMKDTVIVPTDLVRKVGSDFDIDKLSVYLKNVAGGKNIKALEFLTDENSTEEERYFEWVKDIAGKDSKNYFRFLAKDEIKALRKKFKKGEQDNVESYLDEKQNQKSKYKQQFAELFKEKKDSKIEQDLLVKELFADGSRDFWALSTGTLTYFQDLKDSMLALDLEGPIEIENYLSLANKLSKDNTTDNQDKLLLTKLINNYKKILEALGYSVEEIQDILKRSDDISIESSAAPVTETTEIQEEIDELKTEKTNYMKQLVAQIQQVNQENKEKYLKAKQEVNLTWAQEVAAVENIETFDEFKKLSIYDQNPSKNLDNAYIESLFNLTTHPLNFKRLVLPNSAEEAKGLSEEIVELLGETPIDYSLPSNMLSRKFMTELRHAFVSGKYAIGISAVAQTNHAQNQRTQVVLNEENLKYLDSYDAQFLQDTKINFAQHNQIDGKVSLSGILSADGKTYIADTIGQFIDGYVDIAKGPWIMSLGATARTAGTWLFLIKVGVPLKDIAYFMNQPIIKTYLKELESEGRVGLFSTPISEYVMDQYATKSKAKIAMIPEASKLRKMIGKENLDAEQLKQQQFILSEFLKYAKMQEQLLQYIQGSNFDTSNFNDPLLVFKKQVQLEMARESIVSDVDENLQASFVGPLFEFIQNSRDGFQDILVSDSESRTGTSPGPRTVIQEILRPYVSPFINDKTFVKLGRKAVENLFDWTMQTGSLLNGRIAEAFFDTTDSKSTVKEMMNFKQKVLRNQNHPMHNNFVINNLLLDPSGQVNRVDNLYINAKNNKVLDQNLIINSFRELQDYFKDENSDMFDKFMRAAILQSGLTNSYISFTSLLPYEVFKNYYNNYISMLPSNPTLQDFLDLNEFQRTNPTNQDIVPKLVAKDGVVEMSGGMYDFFEPVKKYWNTAVTFMNQNLKDVMDAAKNDMIAGDLEYYPFPKLINVGKRTRYGKAEILSWYWEDVPITSLENSRGVTPYEKKKRMIKNGDYSFRRQGLFKKVYEYNEEGERIPLIQKEEKRDKKTGEVKIYENFVYKAINTRGDGPRLQEHYSKMIDDASGEVLGKRSRVENGFINVVEKSDKEIVDIFYGTSSYKPTVNVEPSVNIPDNIDTSKYPIINKGGIKELSGLDAKIYTASGNLIVKSKKRFTPAQQKSAGFADQLVSLGYTPEQVGAIIKLIC